MKRIKRIVCLVLLLALLLPATLSQAEIQYLIPDSDTRRLTEKEIWQFDRETMSYLFNEILARHGYVFSKGGKYDTWFRSMPWYTPDPKGDNNAAALIAMVEVSYSDGRVLRFPTGTRGWKASLDGKTFVEPQLVCPYGGEPYGKFERK